MAEQKNCVHCGNKAGMLSRTKLADGQFLCYECQEKCDRFFAENFLKRFTYDEYLEYLKHKEINKQKLAQLSIDCVLYDRIAVDVDKGWFIFGKKNVHADPENLLIRNPEVFEAKDLVFAEFYYVLKDYKEGFINDKVEADVICTIAFNNKWYPYAFHEKVLKKHNHKAKRGSIKKGIIISLRRI